ncbi:MAG: zinc finger domain-containing protein [Thermoplasmata archaeon]
MMSVGEVRCSSCGAALAGRGAAHFPCPECGFESLGRCARCRDQSVGYRCLKCGFAGP